MKTLALIIFMGIIYAIGYAFGFSAAKDEDEPTCETCGSRQGHWWDLKKRRDQWVCKNCLRNGRI